MRKVICLCVSGIILVLAGISITEINSEKISKNTYIEDVYVGGLTKKEAQKKLEDKYKDKSLEFKYDDDKWIIDPEEVGINYNIENIVDDAYDNNRNKNLIVDMYNTLSSMAGKKTVLKNVISLDENKLEEKIKDISKDIDVKAKDANVEFENNKVQVKEEQIGLEVDKKQTLLDTIKNIKDGVYSQRITVTKIQPSLSGEDLEDIDNLLATYTTKLSDTSKGRVENIKIACDRTNDIILMPGEEFSYNKLTGYRTEKNGFKNAKVISNGQSIEGVGGGVCQVSTTLFNTVLYSGLDIVERRNHSVPSKYVDKGRDATVTDTGVDFVFKNNFKNPVYIRSYYHGEKVTCQIFGAKNDIKNIKIETEINSKQGFETKRVNDNSLALGKEEVLQKGRNTYMVSTYRVYYDDNGKEIEKKKACVSYYPGREKIISIGTSKTT